MEGRRIYVRSPSVFHGALGLIAAPYRQFWVDTDFVAPLPRDARYNVYAAQELVRWAVGDRLVCPLAKDWDAIKYAHYPTTDVYVIAMMGPFLYVTERGGRNTPPNLVYNPGAAVVSE